MYYFLNGMQIDNIIINLDIVTFSLLNDVQLIEPLLSTFFS